MTVRMRMGILFLMAMVVVMRAAGSFAAYRNEVEAPMSHAGFR